MPDPTTIEELTARNIASVLRIDQQAHVQRGLADRIADRVTAFCGSMHFVWTHVVWFVAWIGWNLEPLTSHFDEYPFPILTLSVSLEAIFLSTFILISENRQSKLAERRNHLDLQVNLLAEQENTKMLQLLVEIARKVGVQLDDAEVEALGMPTSPKQLAAQIERTATELETEKAGAPPKQIVEDPDSQ